MIIHGEAEFNRCARRGVFDLRQARLGCPLDLV
jgi:hypothetical protein